VKRSASILVLLLLVPVILVSFAHIGTVKAIGTVYVRSDGSIEGAGLKLEDGVYVFTGDIYGQILIQKDGVTVDGSGYVLHGMDEGGIFLENRNDVVLRKIMVVDALFGITIVNGRNNIITGSNCSIKLENSFSNTISGNERISLLFTNSSKNIVTENNLKGNTYGFKLQSASNENSIFGNNITNSIGGIEFHGNSSDNNIYENRIANNADGIIIFQSYNNLFHDNLIAYNSNHGIFFQGSSENIFFRNDIVENVHQTGAWLASGNIWDNGSVGNYWSDYNGTDNNGDGIGDEPYYVLTFSISTGEGYDIDNYPLIEPVVIPEFPSWKPLLITLVAILVAGLSIVLILSVFFRQRIKKGRKT
jgi:parallel beta-helix repeat protein